MAILILILALIDSLVFPVQGVLPGIGFAVIALIGVLTVNNAKNWFTLALIMFTIATAIYFFGGGNEVLVHKMSDWSLVFFVIAALKLARTK